MILLPESQEQASGRFFYVPKSTRASWDEKKVRASMAQCLYGEIPKETVFLTVQEITIQDTWMLQNGDRVVVQLKSEEDVSKPEEDPKSKLASINPAPIGKVVVSFIVNNVKAVDAINGCVNLDFQMYLTWDDPSLVGVPVEKRPPYDELWNPEIEINNDVDLEQLWAVFPAAYQGVETGTVRWGARYRGNITNAMDLRLFPFDSDNFYIRVGPKSIAKKDLLLVIDDKKHGCEGAVGDKVKESSLEEWDIGAVRAFEKDSPPSGSGAIYSNAVLEVQIFRRVWYYFTKILLVKLIMIVSCFTVFKQDAAEAFSDRQAHTFTLALTVVAFLYVAGQDLPKVSYLTIMDKYMLLGFVTLFFVGVESFMVFVMATGDDPDPDTAKKIDDWCMILFPCAYVCLMGFLSFTGLWNRFKLLGFRGPVRVAASG